MYTCQHTCITDLVPCVNSEKHTLIHKSNPINHSIESLTHNILHFSSYHIMSTSSTAQESPSPESESSPEIPWEVLDLIASNLDPKTLATAACVSKPWHSAMSSDHLWAHLCTTHFPSLTHLRSATVPSLPYHRLYNISFTSTKRRHRQPSNPRISLQNLIFIITLTNSKPNSPPVTIVAPGPSLSLDHHPLFRFDFDIRDSGRWREFEVSDETIVTWNVVLEGFGGVFTMMDCKGKGSFVSGSDGWFSAELPGSGCCCATSGGGGSSGMVAEMRLVLREEDGGGGGGGGGRRTAVGCVNVGVLSIVSWRYVCVEDVLRYLQHFLEPCDV
ncbi:hypothetical protein SSX86_013360 [Deinandra increscens subsp. villosa]|uniref:F-box protein n=1 Tax=Deinandra increscens subsp. villosa TaxID=3103831 RepID=A0AAP0D6C6_9ASTR